MPETASPRLVTPPGGARPAAGPRRRTAFRARSLFGAVLLAIWGAVLATSFLRGLPEALRPPLEALRAPLLSAVVLYGCGRVGHALRRRWLGDASQRLTPLEGFLADMALGMAVAAYVMAALGFLGLFSVWSAWLLVASTYLGRHASFLKELRELRPRPARRTPVRLLRWALALTAAVTAIETLTPAVSQDALVYHLALPARWIAEGRLSYVESNFFSAFPQFVEMLFTLGLLLDGDILAKCFHWFYGALGVASAGALAARLSRPKPQEAAPWLAALLFATVPTAALIATWAYVDLAVVFFVVLSTLLFVVWREGGDPLGEKALDLGRGGTGRLLALSCGIAGLAAAVKYTGAAQGLFLGALAFSACARAEPKRGLRALLISGAFALAAPALWYLRNLVETGNPVFPFAYGVFGGRSWDAERAAVLSLSLKEWGGLRSGLELLTLPWEVSVSGRFFSQDRFDGVVGFGFLFALPVVLAYSRRSSAARIGGILAGLHFLLWLGTTHQIRFLLPALALVAALAGPATASLRSVPLRVTAAAGLALAVLFNTSLIAKHFAYHRPLAYVLGLESRDAFLERELPGGDYAVFRYIRDVLPEKSRILVAACGNPGFLIARPYHSDALFENRTLAALLEESHTPRDFARLVTERGFTHILFRFDLVFDPSGRRSEIPPEGQRLFAEFLNRYARLEIEAGGTFLYAIKGHPAREESP